MRAYEAMIVLAPPAEDPATQAIVDRVQRIIQEQGGSLEKVEPWGRRRLAYEIAGQREATYFIVHFSGESAVTRELERVLGLSDEVLRHVIVRREETAPTEEGEGEAAAEGAAETPGTAAAAAATATGAAATGTASDGAASPAAEAPATEAPAAEAPATEAPAAEAPATEAPAAEAPAAEAPAAEAPAAEAPAAEAPAAEAPAAEAPAAEAPAAEAPAAEAPAEDPSTVATEPDSVTAGPAES